jgi:HSP20 family molecular chaperone IbpA
MTRVSVFDNPLLLGFDQFERVLDRVAKSSVEGYPPYNIEQINEHGLRITLAVAGFAIDQLEVMTEDKQLIISGRNSDEMNERIYLHRGIAARQFQRSFVLAEGIEIIAARLEDGLLHIDMAMPALQPDVRKIKIEKVKSIDKKGACTIDTINLNRKK